MRDWIGEYQRICRETDDLDTEEEMARRLIGEMVQEMEAMEKVIQSKESLNRAQERVMEELDRRIEGLKEVLASVEVEDLDGEELGRYKVLVERMTEEARDSRAREAMLQDQVGRMAETVDQHNHLSILLVETCQKIIQGPNLILEELQDANRHLKAISATLEESKIDKLNDNR
jgi:hypothetical protein